MLIFLKWEGYESQKQILSFDYDGNVTLEKKNNNLKIAIQVNMFVPIIKQFLIKK